MPRSKIKPNKPAARVLIVDDHPAVREALTLRIAAQPDLEVCGEAADANEALHLAAATEPDVAVIDIALKAGNSIDLIKRLRARNDKFCAIVWSMYSEDYYAERTLRAGAMGYINKEQATGKIIEAIRQVLDSLPSAAAWTGLTGSCAPVTSAEGLCSTAALLQGALRHFLRLRSGSQ